MARINTYEQDSNVSFEDKLLGTDSVTNGTKNFTIQSLMNLINELSGVSLFDGVLFKYQEYDPSATDPRGILNLVGGIAASTPFTSVTQIILSKKVVNGVDVENYLRSFAGKRIKISKQDDFDIFATFKVNSVADYTNTRYLTFAVEHVQSNGSFNPQGLFFASYHSDASVTDLEDVSSAGSGQIITSAERTAISDSVKYTDVKDNLLSTDTNKPLSANQGYVLKGLIDNINTLLTSDNIDLDTLQEVVDFIEANRTTLDSLTISNIAGLQNALDNKVDVVSGKELSTNDFTDALLTKLNGIAAGAEVNVQSDWAEVSATSDAFIQNKPTDLTDLSQHNATELADITSSGSGQIISSAERTKLAGIQAGAEANVQADWNETNSGSDAFIVNKPSITPSSRTIEIAGTANEVDVTPSGPQDLSANRSFTVGLPNDVTIGGDLTVNETIELANAQASTPTFDNGIYYSTEDSHDTLHFRYHGHDISIDHLTENIPTGILNGGELSTNTATTFDVAAGDGVINILNKYASDPHPEIKKVEWSATTVTHTLGNASETDQLNTWVYVDDTGAIQQTSTIPSPSLWRSNIVLGSVIHSENVIRFVKTFPRAAYSNGNTVSEFIEIFGPLKKSGHLLTVNSNNDMALDRSAGVAFALGRNYETNAEEPNLVSDGASTPVFHRYSSTSTGFTKDDGVAGVGYTDIDPTKYDNNGTLTTVSGGHYSVQRLYYFPNNTGVIVAYYGKDEYASMDLAEKNYLLEDFQEAENTSSQAIYLGAIILKSNVSNLNTASDAKILTGGIFRSLSATNLGGVAADAAINDLSDVSITGVTNNQVLKYNGSTGNWENQADDTIGGSGSGVANKIAIWSGASALTQDTNLHWDTTNDRLGIGTDGPFTNLTVYGATDSRIALINSNSGTTSSDGFVMILENDSEVNFLNRESAAIKFATAGTERMRIHSGGDISFRDGSATEAFYWDASAARLGIGTDLPTTPLHIEGSGVGYIQTIKNTTAGGDLLQMLAEDGNPIFEFISAGTGGEGIFSAYSDNVKNVQISADPSNYTYFDASNVGIGIKSPTANLEVSKGSEGLYFKVGGDNASNGRALEFTSSTSSGGSTGALHTINSKSTNGEIALATAGTERMRIDNGGDISFRDTINNEAFYWDASTARLGIGVGSSPSAALDVLGSAKIGPNRQAIFSESNGNNSAIILSSTGNMEFRGSETDYNQLFLKSGGNVGINTTTPSEKLHVSGNARITGAIYDSNNSSGTSGQVLSSTATGTDWISLSAASGVDGSGTTNYVAKWSDTDTITDSVIFDNGTNVGIGTDSPAAKFHTNSSSFPETTEKLAQFNAGVANYQSNRYVELSNSFTGAGYTSPALVFKTNANSSNQKSYGLIATLADGSLSFQNKPAGSEIAIGTSLGTEERMRIDSSGRVAIGTTSIGATAFLTVAGESTNTSVVAPYSDVSLRLWQKNTTDNNACTLYFQHTNSVGTANGTGAIRSICTDHTSGSVDGELSFYTTSAGTISEQMRITSSGDLQFNGSSTISSNTSDGADNAQLIISGGGATGDTRGASVHLAGNENGNGGLLQLRAGNGSISQVRLYTGAEERMRIHSGGDVSFRDTSNNEAFYWDASAASLGIGAIPNEKLEIFDSSNATIQLTSTSSLTGQNVGSLNFKKLDQSGQGAGVTAYVRALDTSGYGAATALTFGTDDGSSTSERMRITSSGVVRVGPVLAQSNATFSARRNGANIEFGHVNNSGGYYGTLGAWGINGSSYIGFSCDNDDTSNTFTTRGIKGNIITGDIGGDLIFSQVTNANASGQTPEERMRIDSSGNVAINDSTTPNVSLTVTSKSGYEDIAYFKSSGTNIDARINLLPTGTGNGAINSASNSLELQTAGVERMRIDSSGNVGIGTTSPTTSYNRVLHINDPANTSAELHITAGGGTTAADGLSIIQYGETSYLYNRDQGHMIFGTSNNERMRITSGGDVSFRDTSTNEAFYWDASAAYLGIGTGSTPNAPLHISSASSTQAVFERTGSTGSYIGLKDSSGSLVYLGDNNGTFEVQTAGSSYSTKLAVTSSGNVGIGTPNPGAPLDITKAASGTSFVSYLELNQTYTVADSKYGILFQNTQYGWDQAKISVERQSTDANFDLVLSSANAGSLVEGIRIDHLGNVGIGTTSPSVPLTVQANSGGNTIRLLGRSADGYSFVTFRNNADSATNGEIGVSDAQKMLFYTGASPRMTIDSSGNVGIGTTSPTAKLHVVGDIVATGDITAYYSSDERLKENKKLIENATDKIEQIGGYEFDWIAKEDVHINEGHDIGVMAQEVEKVLPEVVITRDNGYKAVKYEKLVPLLIESIKELSAQIKELQNKPCNCKK